MDHIPTTPNTIAARIAKHLKIHESRKGSGIRVRRFLGTSEVRFLSPFSNCEYYRITNDGYPPHPYRGCQKVFFLIKGHLRVSYSPQNYKDLNPGDVTVVTAGKGVVESLCYLTPEASHHLKPDTPAPPDVVGIEICLDTPEHLKRISPQLHNVETVKFSPFNATTITLFNGSILGVSTKEDFTYTKALIFYCEITSAICVSFPVQPRWNTVMYTLEGQALVNNLETKPHNYIQFELESEPSQVNIEVKSAPFAFMFISGEPLNQPMYKQGPFVDVSMGWIDQAFNDYVNKENGFEFGFWNDHSNVEPGGGGPPRPNAPGATDNDVEALEHSKPTSL